MMPAPNFFIIGAQKSGTTWLGRALATHPDIFMPGDEIHYFDKRHNYAKGRAWYEAHFAAAGREARIGEKTPDYLWACGEGAEGHLPDVHKNLHAYNSDAMLIAVLRDPVTRAVSAANHLIRTGRVSPLCSIDDLILGSQREIAKRHGVLDKGLYFQQFTAYLDLFPREQLLVLIFEEDVVDDPGESLSKSCRFLDVDTEHEFPKTDARVNEFNRSTFGLTISYYVPKMQGFSRWIDRHLAHRPKRAAAQTLSRLAEFYQEDNERLFELIDRRPRSWCSAETTHPFEPGKLPLSRK